VLTRSSQSTFISPGEAIGLDMRVLFRVEGAV
jgi:hypothetical protein